MTKWTLAAFLPPVVILGLTALMVLAMAMGCASPPSFKNANCQRYRYSKYNILACDDEAVARKCFQICPKDDQGNPLNYYPPACLDTRPQRWGRRPTILVGKSHTNDIPHEIGHVEHPGEAKMVGEKYPRVEEK